MNYNSVSSILSGTSNMTTATNASSTSGTYSTSGVSWFKRGSNTASTISINAKSSISFAGITLKVNYQSYNRRTAIKKEEGTLYNRYKFFKIRFEGYTSTSTSANSAYQMAYNVVLWDTGNISLYITKTPMYNRNGTCSINNLSYTFGNTTFTYDDFTFSYNKLTFALPYYERYLLKDNTTVYTIKNGNLKSLGDDVTLTSSLFINSGLDYIPSTSIMLTLDNPELLYWNEASESVSQLAVVVDPPLPQILLYEAQTIPAGQTIDGMMAESFGNVLYCISFDNGTTWKYYDGNAWLTADSPTSGMSATQLEFIDRDTWSQVATSDTYQIRCALMSGNSSIELVAVRYK